MTPNCTHVKMLHSVLPEVVVESDVVEVELVVSEELLINCVTQADVAVVWWTADRMIHTSERMKARARTIVLTFTL